MCYGSYVVFFFQEYNVPPWMLLMTGELEELLILWICNVIPQKHTHTHTHTELAQKSLETADVTT